MSALAREKIVESVRGWIGTPYLHQASLRGEGCDCLGLVRGVWREVVGPEPEAPGPYSSDWAEAGGVESLAQASARHFRPVAKDNFDIGDVLLFRFRDGVPAKHLAIVATPRTMVHAHDGARVCEVAISLWWRRRLAFAFQFPGVA